MSGHPKLEVLSGYHDGELGRAERTELESHLAICGECQQRLNGLRRMSERLSRLEGLEPPDELRASLDRRVAELGVSRDLIQRLEATIRGIPLQPSLAVIFSLIIALAVIMFLFVHGVDRHRRGLPVRLEPAATSEIPAKPAAGVRRVAGRTFERTEQGWREQGLKADRVDRRIVSESEAGRAWLARHPALAALARLPGHVRLTVDGKIVELVNPVAP